MIGERISHGAKAFLIAEYTVMAIFIVLFGIVVLILVDIYGQGEAQGRAYALVAYIIGCLTSILCGWIGMIIATKTNYRTTYRAIFSLEDAF